VFFCPCPTPRVIFQPFWGSSMCESPGMAPPHCGAARVLELAANYKSQEIAHKKFQIDKYC
jgi:hypothetical protein